MRVDKRAGFGHAIDDRECSQYISDFKSDVLKTSDLRRLEDVWFTSS